MFAPSLYFSQGRNDQGYHPLPLIRDRKNIEFSTSVYFTVLCDSKEDVIEDYMTNFSYFLRVIGDKSVAVSLYLSLLRCDVET